jgi:hypothetical protein
MNRDEDPRFFNLKSGRMANDDICSGKCLLDLFVVLDLNFRSILIDNSFFFVAQKLEINIIYFICF